MLSQIDPNCISSEELHEAFLDAIKRNDRESIQSYFSTFPRVEVKEVKDDRGNNALHLAVQWGHYDLVDSLVNCHGFDVTTKNKDGETPLQLNTSKNKERIESILMKKVKEDSGSVEMPSIPETNLQPQPQAIPQQQPQPQVIPQHQPQSPLLQSIPTLSHDYHPDPLPIIGDYLSPPPSPYNSKRNSLALDRSISDSFHSLSVPSLSEFLEPNHLKDYEKIFTEKGIDSVENLYAYDEEDFKAWGLKIAHRRHLVAILRKQSFLYMFLNDAKVKRYNEFNELGFRNYWNLYGMTEGHLQFLNLTDEEKTSVMNQLNQIRKQSEEFKKRLELETLKETDDPTQFLLHVFSPSRAIEFIDV